jgi:anaerobic nitric oxide reductase flavorubredoxin
MRHIPDTPIYCTKNGIKSLKGHYHQDWDFKVVKTGDRLSLGQKELIFVEAPMLHWPDSMFCYLTSARPEIVKIEISRHQKFNISVAAT